MRKTSLTYFHPPGGKEVAMHHNAQMRFGQTISFHENIRTEPSGPN